MARANDAAWAQRAPRVFVCRKSFAQNHADAGTPPRTLARLLGHSNTRVTVQFYNRVTDAKERAAAAAMDQLLAPLRSKDVV